MAIEIVDLPINSMVIFHCYVKLPEGSNIFRSQTPETRSKRLAVAPHSLAGTEVGPSDDRHKPTMWEWVFTNHFWLPSGWFVVEFITLPSNRFLNEFGVYITKPTR